MKRDESLKLLREFINMTIGYITPGAGVVLVRRFGEDIKVLGMMTPKGKLDIPKGGIEPGEFPLEAALRETKEECGIVDLSFEWGFEHLTIDGLTCYVASTTQDPIISENPHTGILEHISADWLSWDEIAAGVSSYLVPCIRWAQKIVQSK